MLHYSINPKYKEIEKHFSTIQKWFPEEGSTIYKIRNEIKVIELEGHRLCVKAFAPANPINRIVYAWLRKSKAKRSFLNAFKLQKLGIDTPEHLAWLEFRNRFGFLTHSYYISLYQEHAFTLAGVFGQKMAAKEEILRDYAHFAWEQLHLKGVKHLDLGQGNVLVRPHTEKWHFSLVDINRMKFNQKGLRHRGFSNLRRLNASPIEMAMLASYYAEARQSNPLWGIIQLGWYKLRFQKLRNLRKSITRPLKNMAFAS